MFPWPSPIQINMLHEYSSVITTDFPYLLRSGMVVVEIKENRSNVTDKTNLGGSCSSSGTIGPLVYIGKNSLLLVSSILISIAFSGHQYAPR